MMKKTTNETRGVKSTSIDKAACGRKPKIEIPDAATDEQVRPMELPNIYYDDTRKEYWREAKNGDFISINSTSLKRCLKGMGLTTIAKGAPLSEVDQAIEQIETENNIVYAGPLAGHRIGECVIASRKVLVTDSPSIVEPQAGDCTMLFDFLFNLFGNDQLTYFLGWLRLAFESLRDCHFRPGQALLIAGEANCGKSFLQRYIITKVLGGRTRDPFQYMVKETTFNGELFGAEHQMVQDKVASKSFTFSPRHAFGEAIKDLFGGGPQRCHHKHRQAFTLEPFWRLTVSVNDEMESLTMLPSIDESLRDKILLFKAQRHPMPMDTSTTEGYVAFKERLEAEVPHLLHWMLHDWTIPKEILGGRFGIKAYANEELLTSLQTLSPEAQLLDLIDSTVFALEHNIQETHGGAVAQRYGASVFIELPKDGGRGLAFKAEELEAYLLDSDYREQARGLLLKFRRATGTYLGRLAKERPDRVRQYRVKGVNKWILIAPVESADDEGNGAE